MASHLAASMRNKSPAHNTLMEHIIMPMHLGAIWATWGLTGISSQRRLFRKSSRVLCSWRCRRHSCPPTVQWRAASDMFKLPIPRIKEKHAKEQAWLVASSSSHTGKLTTGLLLLNVCHHLIIALATELAGLLQEWIGCPASVRMCPESWLSSDEQPKLWSLQPSFVS